MADSPWLTVPIFGAWLDSDDQLRPGTYRISCNVQVTSQSLGAIVLPKGVVKMGQLNTDETKMDRNSLIFYAPAADDGDLFPQNFVITIEVFPEASDPVTFKIITEGIQAVGGIDLRLVVLPQVLPPDAPFPIAGVPGGLARLNAQGQVVNANNVAILPGGVDLSEEELAEIAGVAATKIDIDDMVLIFNNAII